MQKKISKVSSPERRHGALSFVQRTEDTFHTMNKSQLAELSYEEGWDDAIDLMTKQLQANGFVHKSKVEHEWHDNDPEKFKYFYDDSVFLVYTENEVDPDDEPKGSYDLVCVVIQDDHMYLQMAYSHEEFNKEWHEVIRFCLIEGEMPSEFE